MNMDKFELLAGSAEMWGAVLLALAISTLLARAGFMLLGHLKLFQSSSINAADMAANVFKIGFLVVAGLVYFSVIS